MDWWQIVLIVVACVIGEGLVGYLLSYLIITRIFKEPFRQPFSKKRETTEQQVKEQLKREVEEAGKAKERAKREAKDARERTKSEAEEARERTKREAEEARERTKREAEEAKRTKEAAVVEEPLESIAPDLLAEAKNNRRIATELWTGKLLPFQTNVWDTSQGEVFRLPRNLREDLTQAYVDMRLANSIVWLSMELGRRSHNLDENYMKLCANIAVRLDRITP